MRFSQHTQPSKTNRSAGELRKSLPAISSCHRLSSMTSTLLEPPDRAGLSSQHDGIHSTLSCFLLRYIDEICRKRPHHSYSDAGFHHEDFWCFAPRFYEPDPLTLIWNFTQSSSIPKGFWLRRVFITRMAGMENYDISTLRLTGVCSASELHSQIYAV